MSEKVIQSALYSKFDQRAGPVPACWHPLSSPKDALDKAAIASMNISFGADELPEKVAILPVPDGSSKIVVRCIKYRDHASRGHRGESTLSLVVSEAGDAVLYKYLPDFQPIFDDYAARIAKREESKQPVEPALLASFYDTISKRLEELRSHELGQRGEVAFPDEATGTGKAKGAEYAFKIIVIGDPSVGKTSLILKYTDNAFRQTYLPTIGTNLTEKSISLAGIKVNIIFWDIAGQTKYVRMRKHFYAGARGAILVFDLTSKETLLNIKDWYNDVKNNLDKDTPIHFIILGNKNDIQEKREVGDLEARSIAAKLHIPYFETSAKTGENVEKAISYISTAILKNPNESV